MIRYYLAEEPTLAQVDTYVCAKEQDRKYVLEQHRQAGGQGRRRSRRLRHADGAAVYQGAVRGVQGARAPEPRKYIAQHRIELSTCPTWDPANERLSPRRVDLRPFILTRPDGSWVLPGGLTRVALVEGSYVVNSSQGGGSKDTWVEREVSL